MDSRPSLRRYVLRLTPVPLLLLVLVLLPSCRSEPRTEILWDTYGVPHIFAATSEELFQAHGWSQMKAHGDLILQLYGRARGRAAEYWGEAFLESDVWMRARSVPARGEAWHAAQDAEMDRYLRAFVQGMNAYAREHPEAISQEMRVVLPLEPPDVMAHVLQTIHFSFVSGLGAVARPLRERFLEEALGEPVRASRAPECPRSSGWASAGPEESGETGWWWTPAAESPGSNAWAIGPSRSASGNAMLLVNPHLSWGDLHTWFESHLVGPDFDAYGATLVGMPLVTLGFNQHLGWAHTVNTYDGSDVYELLLERDGYLLDGEVRPFDVRVDTLLVKEEEGSFSERILTGRSSIHGPVLGVGEGKAYAVRVAGLDDAGIFRQYYDMLRARNLAEFEEAVAMLQMPMFTFMYADREGRIMHLFNGRVPRRALGDVAYWARPVPGHTSETLWTDYHPYQDLPKVVDPESGWLQNANDPPWTTTFPRPASMDPALYPAYTAPRSMHARAQRSARMLLENDSITFGQMVALKHSTRMELADRLLDELLEAVRGGSGEEIQPARDGAGALSAAARVLEGWDRKADVGSRGAVLFVAWVEELFRRTGGNPYLRGWDPADPMGTPAGLADPGTAVAALEAAARAVVTWYAALDVPFGDVYRLRRDGLDLPGNGYSDPLGVFRAARYRPGEEGRQEIVAGDTFVLAVEFGRPIRAMAQMGYGNASQPGSPHRTDQLQLFSEKRMRPVWLTRGDVEANLSSRTVLRLPGEPGGGR